MTLPASQVPAAEAGIPSLVPKQEQKREKARALRMLNVVILLTLATLCWLAWVSISGYRQLDEGHPKIDRIEQLRGTIMFYDEALTMSAQMSAATGDPKWEVRYRALDEELSAAFQEINQLAPNAASRDAVQVTEDASRRLLDIELGVFLLVGQGKNSDASELLSSAKYEDLKAAYANGIDNLGKELNRGTKRELERQHANLAWSLAAVLVIAPLLLLAWWLVVRAAHRWENTIEERTEALLATNHELQLAREIADEANQAKTKFLSRMSHELRTPLNSILGFGQLMEESDLSIEQRQDVELILKSGGHLLGLIDEVLEIARIESGTQSVSVEPIDVLEVVNEGVGLVASMASEKHVSVQVIDSVRRYALADRRRILQVVLNVLTNSIKYNVVGGTVRVRLYGEPKGMTVIEIADTGIGMTAVNLTKLFTPFERLGAEALHIDGTGLGLALSKSLVESMGGTFSVASEDGVGSVFTISLVRSRPFQVERSSDAVEKHTPMPHITTPCTVLLIEDNPPNVRLIQQLFESEKHARLLTAENGRDGINLARRSAPEVILLDLHLPDISGQTVLAELKGDKSLRHIPVIVLTADAFAVLDETLIAAGAFACFSKPVRLAALMESVRDALEVNCSAA